MRRTPKARAGGAPVKRAARARGGRGKLAPRAKSRGPRPADVALDPTDAAVAETAALIAADGGIVLGSYRDPLDARPLLLASLPLAAVAPTPFQRELSPTHARRLAEKIEETGIFLDPLIVVRGADRRWWTPNGRHRLAASKFLGLERITALISPDQALAFRILALNTEKAHNLRDRSLESIRMAREIAKRHRGVRERDHAGELESPELLTLGIVYERSGRFGGGAYSSFLKKVDRFSDQALAKSLTAREGHAARLQEIDRQVKRIVAALTARGFKSPYLRNYVVARINPVRFHKVKRGAAAAAPPMPLGQALTRMNANAKRFDSGSVSNADLAWVAVGAEGTSRD
ncbi:MAG: ParB N-terminal domain-containing protein [Steroidobacteraceae bacterium]